MNEVYYMCYLCSFYLKNLAMATNLTTPSFQIQEGMQVENSEVWQQGNTQGIKKRVKCEMNIYWEVCFIL